MPNWKKVIVSGSDASLNSLNVTAGVTGSLLGTASYATQALTASNANTASYVLNAVSSSFASTASYVNPLNQNVLITGSATNSLRVKGSGATSATNALLIENSGNTGSLVVRDDARVGINTTTPNTTLDVNGNVIVTGSLTVYGPNTSLNLPIYPPNYYYPTLTIANTTFQGYQTSGNIMTIANTGYAIQFGSNKGYMLFQSAGDHYLQSGASNITRLFISSSGRIGIAKSSSLNATLDIIGNQVITGSLEVSAGITGSFLGTASYATQALTASNANTASYVSNAVSASFASTASYVNLLNQNVTIYGDSGNTGTSNILSATTANGASSRFYIKDNGNYFIGNGGSYSTSGDVSNRTVNEGLSGLSLKNVSSLGSLPSGVRLTPINDEGIHLLTYANGGTTSKIAIGWYDGTGWKSAFDVQNGRTSLQLMKDGGNILIGTTTDLGYKLDVSGSGNFRNNLTVTGSVVATSFTGSLSGTSSFASTASYVNPLNQNVTVTGSASNSLRVKGSGATSATNTVYVENSSGQNTFLIRDDGNVGIGTASPLTKLQVVGGNDQGVYSTSTNNIAINGVGSGVSSYGIKGETDLGTAIRSNITNTSAIGLEVNYTPTNNSLFKVLGDGNVGIGTASPLTKLHVNGNILITGSLTVGATSLGANENTLVLGPAPAGGTGEGGQILLQASGGLYTSASMWDNWQNYTRLLRGTNASSDAVVAQFNMHSKQVSFPQYNSPTAFTATTLVGLLGFDSSGNLLTTTTSSGGGGGGVTITNNTDNYIITATGTANTLNGESNLQFNGSSLTVTGQITSSGAIISTANNTMYFRGGDDAEFWDINVANTVGIYGQQTQGVGAVKLGSGGPTLYGSGSNLGIGTTTPNSGTLHVNGGVFASSFTGSLLGTASYAALALTASNANTASYVITAQTASYVLQAVSSSFASTASYVNPLNQNVLITGSATNALRVKGSGATSATNALLIENSTNTSSLVVRNDNYVSLGTPLSQGYIGLSTTKSRVLQIQYDANNVCCFEFWTDTTTSTSYIGGRANLEFWNTANGKYLSYDFTNFVLNTSDTILIVSSSVKGGGTNNGVLNGNNTSTSSGTQIGIYGSSRGSSASNTNVGAWITATGGLNNYGLIVESGSVGIGKTSPNAKLDINGNTIITGSLNVTAGITGSLSGTASYATTALTSSFASTASFVNPLNQNVLITGSTQITGSLGVTGSIYSNNTIGTSYAGYFKNNSYNVGGNAPLMVDDGNAGGAFSIGYGGTSAFMYFPSYAGNNSIYLHGSGYYGVYFEGLSSYDGVTSFVAPGRVKIGDIYLPSSKLHVVGAGSTSATTTFLTQNSSGTDLLKVTDDGATTIVGNTTITGSLTVSSSNATQLQVGSNLLYVNNSNDVGIGTTSPSSYLAGTSGLAVRNSNAGGQGISLSGTNNAYNWLIYRMGSGAYLSFYEQAYNRERLTIAASGEVGIGAPTTAAKLAIYGAGSTSATTTLLLQNASSTDLFKITDNGATTVIGTLTVSGSTTLTGSLNITGSILNSPITLPTSSGTASMDCSRGNFFNLTLSSSYALHLSASNIQPGQTINLRLTQPATSGSLTYTSQFKFAGGIPYSASATGSAVDIISFISFDTSTLYGSAIKNVS